MGNLMNNTLVERLTLAALALPALMQTAQAGRTEETYNADFQYAHYEESNQRMQADVFDFSAAAPIGKAFTASIDLVRDTLSGASPMFNLRNAQGEVQQVLSGASIREQRDAVNASLSYAFDDVAINLGGGVSNENDYLAHYISTGLNWELNQKMTTLSFSASVSFDEVSKTGQPDFKRSKTSQQYLLGITQIIDKDSLLQSNMTFSYHHGYLSDPYKLVFIEGQGVRSDSRPEKKFQWAWLTRYVRYFKSLHNAALHADYRFYIDDWGVQAHTAELSWQQPIIDGWIIMPRFRYYSQDQASFYSAVFDSSYSSNIHSSDYRLAGFGAVGGGIKLSKTFLLNGFVKDIKLQTAFDYYQRKASYQIGGSSKGGFDNFSFYMVTASINVKF
ncbi:MAG: hypothetical protein methR_P1324 [Methyloprofundus sp.]|nr:MAG: hypothetical protein methR_P1324 [Methyloprofundus sp.]